MNVRDGNHFLKKFQTIYFMILHEVLYNLPCFGCGEVESVDLHRVGYSMLLLGVESTCQPALIDECSCHAYCAHHAILCCMYTYITFRSATVGMLPTVCILTKFLTNQ